MRADRSGACVHHLWEPLTLLVRQAGKDGSSDEAVGAGHLAVASSAAEWVLPKGTRAATLAVGNCVPPRLSQAIMKAAMGESPAPPPRKRQRSEGDDRLDQMERRLSDVEARLSRFENGDTSY